MKYEYTVSLPETRAYLVTESTRDAVLADLSSLYPDYTFRERESGGIEWYLNADPFQRDTTCDGCIVVASSSGPVALFDNEAAALFGVTPNV